MSVRLSLIKQQPLWATFSICGSDGENEADQQQNAETGQNGSPAGGAGEGEGQGDPQKKIAALTEEKDRWYTKLQASITELDELRKFKEEAERAKLSDSERRDAETKDMQAKLEQSTQVNRRLAIQNAFLVTNDVQWVNPSTALKLVDLSEVKVDENGQVTNPDVLKEAIKKLAKDEPYLVAQTKQKDEEQEKRPPANKSGDSPNGSPPNVNGIDQAKLVQKYPQLASHLR